MIHIDLWAQNGGTFNVKLVDLQVMVMLEPTQTLQVKWYLLDVSSWKSVDLPLADFMDATKTLGVLF